MLRVTREREYIRIYVRGQVRAKIEPILVYGPSNLRSAYSSTESYLRATLSTFSFNGHCISQIKLRNKIYICGPFSRLV